MACILTTVNTLTVKILFKDLHKLIEPNTTFTSFLEPLKETLEYKSESNSRCTNTWQRNYTEEQHFILDLKCNYVCNLFNETAPQGECGLMGTLDKVGITILSYLNMFQTTIFIEGCYFTNVDNEKEEMLWIISNFSFYLNKIATDYLNNVTTRFQFQINNGEVFFGDGSKECARLCERGKMCSTQYEGTPPKIFDNVSESPDPSPDQEDINVVKLVVFILIGVILVSIFGGYLVYKTNESDRDREY